MKLLILVGLLVIKSAIASEPLQLVTGNEYKPFTDQSLPEGGLSTLIVKKAFANQGMDTEISFMPWSRGYESTKNGLYVATFPYVKRAEREQDFLYSHPINSITQLVYTQKGSALDIQSAADLAGHSTCVPRGYSLTASVNSLIDAGKVQSMSAPDSEQCFLMLKYGRVDFLTFNQFVGWSAAISSVGDNARMEFKTLSTPLETETLHLIISRSLRGAEALLDSFNKGLEVLKENHQLETFEKRYINQ